MQYMKSRNLRPVVIWLWSGAALIFLMVVVGGITRLTGSGLSMSDWNLVMGAIPPLNHEQWQEAFQYYQQFPQYQQLNKGMTMLEFKYIFFWEYLHRMLGRLIGLVFIIPFLFFWIRGYFTSRLRNRMFVLFGLGALEGAMGWFMVKSGLVDVPYVSHYRLAAHFLLAIILIGCCVWFAKDISERPSQHSVRYPRLRKGTAFVGVLFLFQILWGAFTAGLEAGLIYNTFPLMNGSWLPNKAWMMEPLIRNFFSNPGTVQWMHRIIGTLLGSSVIVLWWRTRSVQRIPSIYRKATILLAIIVVQYLLGIFTLLFHVPVTLGVIHQAVAILFGIAWLNFYHKLRNI